MNLNKKIGFLLDNGLSPNFITSLTESQVNTFYKRLTETKKENKEATTTTVQKTTYSAGEAKGKSFPGVTTVNPDGSITVTKEGEIKEDDSETDLDWALKGRTQEPKQVGPDTDDGFDDYDDGTGQIDEKFESKAQQGLFWARCNKCKSENCKWCKMAKEFSKSTSKKEYENMPEKIHPEKTVKYKKKKTNEEFTMANYFDKVASVYANNAMGKTVDSLTKENFVKKYVNKIVENNLRPTMKKRDLLKLIESEIKNKKNLSEDFYMEEMDEEIDFDIMSDVETAPIIKPKIKPKTPEKEPEWAPDEDEPIVPSPEVSPEPQAKKGKFKNFKKDFDSIMNRMDESFHKPIKIKRF